MSRVLLSHMAPLSFPPSGCGTPGALLAALRMCRTSQEPLNGTGSVDTAGEIRHSDDRGSDSPGSLKGRSIQSGPRLNVDNAPNGNTELSTSRVARSFPAPAIAMYLINRRLLPPSLGMGALC